MGRTERSKALLAESTKLGILFFRGNFFLKTWKNGREATVAALGPCAFYFGSAGGYVGGAESCVECALWTASAAKDNPSVVNHPVVAIDFLHGIETARDPETVSTQTSFWLRSLRNTFSKLKS